MAAILTGLAYLAAGSTETSREGTLAVTNDAALTLFLFLPAYSLTVGLGGAALLWRLNRRGVIAWNVTGAALGIAASAILGLVTERGIVPVHLAIAAGLSLVLFLLIRWIAGVRSE
jgi:hypothetical protein